MTTPLHDSPTPSHADAVRRLDRAVAEIDEARAECLRGLRYAAEHCTGEDAFEYTAGAMDVFAMSLEQALNEIVELKLRHPAAWDASEGGRRQRAVRAEIDRVVRESLAILFVDGLRSTGGDSGGKGAPRR